MNANQKVWLSIEGSQKLMASECINLVRTASTEREVSECVRLANICLMVADAARREASRCPTCGEDMMGWPTCAFC